MADHLRQIVDHVTAEAVPPVGQFFESCRELLLQVVADDRDVTVALSGARARPFTVALHVEPRPASQRDAFCVETLRSIVWPDALPARESLGTSCYRSFVAPGSR